MDVITPLPSAFSGSAHTAGDMFQLIRRGAATSRSEIARLTGLAPSTVSVKVDSLLRSGLIIETGIAGRGGRNARTLSVNEGEGFVVSVDLGASHVRIAVANLAGTILADKRYSTELLSSDSAATVSQLWDAIEALIAEHKLHTVLLHALVVGVPAPVQQPEGRIASPSFMPKWNNANLTHLFMEHTSARTIIENDANLHAIAECPPGVNPDEAHLLAVKLGTGIGCGIISAGSLHRGFNGAAGEIAHTQAAGTAATSCTCNVDNCLESVASGRAILAQLRADGSTVASIKELVELGEHGDARTVEILREAGRQIGATLSGYVNFFNPNEVVLGGTMSSSSPLVAAIRAELFRICLPLMTENLTVRTTRPGVRPAIRGGLRLALDTALETARVNTIIASSDN